ncbi:hypothetical protein N658DRAFT_508777 [Parathielavia hyrcaniae]|uniref:Uncharacterized protein n=1 Tax=Parathielavia hyrcaniae TaxID=113614 RepID=A0AAN6PWX6_9PEZI|nr:hypothetical protein N658DRAFT_508777 [Parathielavia hyrcaniae]
MPAFTSPRPIPPQPENRRYAPLTPSPLNPNTPSTYLRTIQQHRRRPRTTTTAAAVAAPLLPPSNSNSNIKTRPTLPNPSHSPANRTQQRYAQLLAHESPTRRLLRQKAAAAWQRSEVLRLHHHHHHHHQNHTPYDQGCPDCQGQCQPEPYQPPHPNPDAARGTAAAGGRGRGAGGRGATPSCSHHHPATASAGTPASASGTVVDPDHDHISSGGGGSGSDGGWEADDLLIATPLTDTDRDAAGHAKPGEEEVGTGAEEGEENDIPGRDGGLLMKGDNCRERNGSGSDLAMLDWPGGSGERGRGGTAWGGGGGCVHGFEGGPLGARLGAVHFRGGKAWRTRGSGGGTLRRMLIVVAVVMGLGLVHGLASAFGNWNGGGGVGGRPPSPPGR